MRSIVGEIGSEAFPRIRVGIGDKPEGWELADWVLSHYATKEERQVAFDAYMLAADAALCFVKEGVEATMRNFNGK
jgi:PTH1 family peptidyl-tRNA hydrolase